MNTNDALSYVEKLASKAEALEPDSPEISGLISRAKEFFRVHVGEKSEFYNSIMFLDDSNPNSRVFSSILRNFQEYVKDGFSNEFTPLEKAQINVVSDFLGQALQLIQDKNFHPAAACIIVGASLEEFLRNWCERKDIKLGNRKPGITAYADALSAKDLITKQDVKDIMAWGGLRNEAAHGNWSDLSDRARPKIMLEGVNLFIRKYSAI